MASKAVKDVVRRVLDEGVPAYRAAREAGVAPGRVYTELRDEKLRRAGLCPCCGQKLPDK